MTTLPDDLTLRRKMTSGIGIAMYGALTPYDAVLLMSLQTAELTRRALSSRVHASVKTKQSPHSCNYH